MSKEDRKRVEISTEEDSQEVGGLSESPSWSKESPDQNKNWIDSHSFPSTDTVSFSELEFLANLPMHILQREEDDRQRPKDEPTLLKKENVRLAEKLVVLENSLTSMKQDLARVQRELAISKVDLVRAQKESASSKKDLVNVQRELACLKASEKEYSDSLQSELIAQRKSCSQMRSEVATERLPACLWDQLENCVSKQKELLTDERNLLTFVQEKLARLQDQWKVFDDNCRRFADTNRRLFAVTQFLVTKNEGIDTERLRVLEDIISNSKVKYQGQQIGSCSDQNLESR